MARLRKEIKVRHKWNLADIIESDKHWEDLFIKIEKIIPNLAVFHGKLTNSEDLKECFDSLDKYEQGLETLYVYARMKRDEDGNVTKYQAMAERADMLAVRFNSAISYVVPEITNLPKDTIEFLSGDPLLADYSYRLHEIARNKEHILSSEIERVLADTQSFTDGFQEIFTCFNDVDLKFLPVTDSLGNKHELTHGLYQKYMQSPDRTLRMNAFNSMLGAYRSKINMLASTYSGSVKKDVFFARVRNYGSALSAALDREDITPEVYNNLISEVRRALPLLHKYVAFRKKALKVDDLHLYDMAVPIVEGSDIQLPYEPAYDLVTEALKPLGPDYQEFLNDARKCGWIDVFENEGKRSGAYSWGTYNAHPYVLLNYQQTTHDIFTIAHELGHAMHTYYSQTAQCHAKSSYQIFVAEIASTVNEVLLIKHLLAAMPDKKVKKYLLSYYLDMFRTTVFRQTMFAEFEREIHRLAEFNEALTHNILSDTYLQLNKIYYGDTVLHDELISVEWARIPHFYRAFYVYKYATGLISAVAIASKILKEGGGAVESYKKFLSAGGSMSPLDSLKLAGIDLTKKDTYVAAFKEFENTLNELMES